MTSLWEYTVYNLNTQRLVVIYVGSQIIEVIGAWVVALGTVSSAISSTPMRGLKGENRKKWEYISEHLDFGGNSFQAIGNILEAYLGENSILEEAGEIIQASGNVTVLFSLMNAEVNVEKSIVINIIGNAQQAFGGLIAALDELTAEEIDISGVSGNLLQSIGNTLQSIAGLVELEIVDLKKVLKAEQKETLEAEVPELSDGVIFNEVQDYSGRWREYEVIDLYGGSIFNEDQDYDEGSPEGGATYLYDVSNFNEIQDYNHRSPEGEVSDLSDGVIFDALQELDGETESNELIKQYEELALLIKYSGSWIQAAGSIISAYSEQQELGSENGQLELEKKKKMNTKTTKSKKRKKKSEDRKPEGNHGGDNRS